MKISVVQNPLQPSNPQLDSFLGVSHHDREAFAKLRQQLIERHYPREALAKILQEYNKSIGNDASALNQIQKLKDSQSVCVITGQQLGFMGGPSYTILKALTCLLAAREMDAIPIFWLATEDHDIAEINHTYLLDSQGNLEKTFLSFPNDGRSVEDLEISLKNADIIDNFLNSVKRPKGFSVIPGQSYASAMANFLVSLFAGTGLVFIEPRYLRSLAVPFFEQEIEECGSILNILRQTTKELEEAGGHAVLPLREGTNLFLKEERMRCKIRFDGFNYTTGKKDYTKQELVTLINREPERFSTNVAARPVFQSKLFPTLAYIAGPTEIAYFRQLRDYHRYHQVLMPCIIPRLSATLIPSHAEMFLKQCRLNPWESLPHHWIELMPHLAESIHSLNEEWNQSAIKHFKDEISPDILMRYTRWAARKVQRKVCKLQLKRDAVPGYALHYLRNLIHPHSKPQERVLNWYGFQAYTDENLVESFLQTTQWQTNGHLYCYF